MSLKVLINQVERVIIYGAGTYGTIVAQWIQLHPEWNEKNICIAVTKKSAQCELNGYKIKEISELTDYVDNSLVIISVSEEKQNEIRAVVEEKGFSMLYAITRSEFLKMKRVVQLEQKNDIERLQELNIGYMQEILWGMNLNRVIECSRWCKVRDFTAGGAAVGSYYLYILYKILESEKFSNLLDIGMGQTSKMIGQYVKWNKEAKHVIVENDKEWIGFCSKDLQLGSNSIIKQMEYTLINKDGYDVRVYEGFKEKMKGEKYDFISIDAPFGCDMKQYSRIDILEILPECLKESWIIMIDDTEREGEFCTVRQIENILLENNINYCSKEYTGTKSFTIITSMDNRFFCTV